MNSKKLKESIKEVRALEKTRAKELTVGLAGTNWLSNFREQYIVRGFLMPLYTPGSMSFQTRIGSFGKYILPDSKYDQPLSLRDGTRIRNEDVVFWRYLIDGQEIFDIDNNSEFFKKTIKIEGMPAVPVWRAVNEITEKLNLSGEMGGGVFPRQSHLDVERMLDIVGNVGQLEDDEGWLEDYSIPGAPRWASIFWKYQRLQMNNGLEVRPVWFHILNYAIYDLPIQRIPVIFVLYSPTGKIEKVHFSDDRLSQQARSTISDALSKAILRLHEIAGSKSVKKKQRDMVYWIWYHIGNSRTKIPLSYKQIGAQENTPERTIQSSVRRMGDKLKKLDYRLICELMSVGEELGLGSNFVYQALVRKEYAPEREIDGFSSIEEIKRAMTGFNPKQQ